MTAVRRLRGRRSPRTSSPPPPPIPSPASFSLLPRAIGLGWRSKGWRSKASVGVERHRGRVLKPRVGGETRRTKSLRISVHHANAVVWGPVYRTRLESRGGSSPRSRGVPPPPRAGPPRW
jgi:hypothetical protein